MTDPATAGAMTRSRARGRGAGRGVLARFGRPASLVASLVGLAGIVAPIPGHSARAAPRDEAILHEPIPPNAVEDQALRATLDGDLPAAIQTPHAPGGIVSAPDPLLPPAPSEAAYGITATRDAFAPDTDTTRPLVSGYDDPFTPSTAPFKRLEAFDMVLPDYRLEVRDARLVPLAVLQGGDPPRADEDAFYADLVIDLPPTGSVRLPGVGPGARVVQSRLGVGEDELPFRILRDGADNWFLEPTTIRGAPRQGGAGALPGRARLVMELAIARAAFGGPPADLGWVDLPFVAPLPEKVARDAAIVRTVIGVSRAMRPRDAITKLVEYFRGFTESAEPLPARGSVYLDLALSRKGVCRHRAFAFLVTAQSLGIPTRLVENEAHAWVEIHDGTFWRRIDLGGAGRMPESTASRLAGREPYEPPADAFPWPKSADPGDTMVARAGVGPPPPTSAGNAATTPPPRAVNDDARADHRPPSTVTVAVTDGVAHRGAPLQVRGNVRSDDEPCGHLAVDVWLNPAPPGKAVFLGTLATGDDGNFDGAVFPTGLPLGDYDVSAETRGDGRCGASEVHEARESHEN